MSSPLGMYGGYKYESSESRALGSITTESYDYRDQTAFMSKLVNDVSYMASYMRKMQKGIDDANQNFMQQIQSFINDIIVLLGGGGDTGFDFGDLKYILQAFGALFGFKPGNPLPINLFAAAWHFFSNYILPVGNFQDAINEIIDSLIASVLDIFGEIPIVGQALQQLAVIISDIRDLIMPIFDAIETFLGVFNITIGDLQGIENFFGPLKPIWEALANGLAGISLPDFTAMFKELAKWTAPVVGGINTILNALTHFVGIITGTSDLQKLDQALADLAKLLGLSGLASGQPIDVQAWATQFIANLGASLETSVKGIVDLPKLIADITAAGTGATNALNELKLLIDGIWGAWKNDSTVGHPVQDAINAILGIFGVATDAQYAAAQANMGVSAILAAQAGGYSDEFDYTMASNLPAVWQKKSSIADSYGPSGSGTAIGVMAGTGLGTIWYVQITKPLLNADMKCTAVLSRLPWWDLFVKSAWYIAVQANSTNQECYRVSIQNDRCQFQRVSTTGAVTNIGALKTIPVNAIGIPYALEIKGNTLSLYRNGILAASETVTGPLVGRMVGFGGEKVAYTNVTDNPLAQFAGIAWQ